MGKRRWLEGIHKTITVQFYQYISDIKADVSPNHLEGLVTIQQHTLGGIWNDIYT